MKGLDLAGLDPETKKAIEDMVGDLLIVLVQRFGGEVDIHMTEIDEMPRGKVLAFSIDPKTKVFHFEVKQK